MIKTYGDNILWLKSLIGSKNLNSIPSQIFTDFIFYGFIQLHHFVCFEIFIYSLIYL